jgi:hypothetical protein
LLTHEIEQEQQVRDDLAKFNEDLAIYSRDVLASASNVELQDAAQRNQEFLVKNT